MSCKILTHLLSRFGATICNATTSRRRVMGPGLQDVEGGVPSRGQAFDVIYRALPIRLILFVGALNLSPVQATAGPANDYFASGIVTSGLTTTVTGSNVGATKETGEPYHAGNIGGKSVWWMWTAPSAVSVTINTSGSSFDTLLAVYTGASVSSLTTVASNDDSGGMQSRGSVDLKSVV